MLRLRMQPPDEMHPDGIAQLVDGDGDVVAVGVLAADAEVALGGRVVTSLRFVGESTPGEEDDPA